MRSYFPFVPLLLAIVPACGQAALDPPSGPVLTASAGLAGGSVAGRVRLTTSLADGEYQGYRFTDGAIITTRLLWVGNDAVPEVRGSDGTILSGDAQRTDLQYRAGRYTYLGAPGNALCLLPGTFASVATVDGSKCTTWSHLQLLNLVGKPTTNAVGTGLVVRTASGGFRMWVAESGWDEAHQNNFVLIDYVADPRIAGSAGIDLGTSQCATEQQSCQVRDDCCNSRHSCTSGRCGY